MFALAFDKAKNLIYMPSPAITHALLSNLKSTQDKVVRRALQNIRETLSIHQAESVLLAKRHYCHLQQASQRLLQRA